MSGRPWIFILLSALPYFLSGCQVDGGTPKLWNPFVRADKDKFADEELPKFVRRISDDSKDKTDKNTPPIAESRVKSLLAEGQQALQENRISDAGRAYKEVLAFLPDDPTAHHGMAMAADLTENWTEAEEHYRQALRARPRDANLLCDIGYSYLLQNRYSEASSYLSQAIQINPNHENAHTNLALLDVRQGNPEAARSRLMQRYGEKEKVTQILAALQSQTGSGTTSNLAVTAPDVPANATFAQVRDIANRERIAAEQRRATKNIPVDDNTPLNAVSAASHSSSNSMDPYRGPEPQVANEQRALNPGTNSNFTTGGNPGTDNYSAGTYPSNAGLNSPSAATAQFRGNPNVGAQTNPYPMGGNANMNPAYSSQAAPGDPSSQNSSMSQYANGNSSASGNANQANYGGNQLPLSQGNPAAFPKNTSESSGVIAVHPSGTFQTPTQGVSYGQPLGFGQPASGTTSYQTNGNAASVGSASPGYAATGNQAYQNNNVGSGYMDAPQNRTHNQNNQQVQLDGLNVGPGSLFPIGQGNGSPLETALQNGTGSQNGTLKMGNVSAPGSNSVINGAMYGQPVSTLPSQEWMIQQQQQIQQLRSPSQVRRQDGQGNPDPSNIGQGNNQGTPNSQYYGSNSQNPQYGVTNGNGGAAGPHAGVPSTPVNPLATYENQLRQLDNQYNNTLQQLDRNATANVPRAQY